MGFLQWIAERWPWALVFVVPVGLYYSWLLLAKLRLEIDKRRTDSEAGRERRWVYDRLLELRPTIVSRGDASDDLLLELSEVATRSKGIGFSRQAIRFVDGIWDDAVKLHEHNEMLSASDLTDEQRTNHASGKYETFKRLRASLVQIDKKLKKQAIGRG